MCWELQTTGKRPKKSLAFLCSANSQRVFLRHTRLQGHGDEADRVRGPGVLRPES